MLSNFYMSTLIHYTSKIDILLPYVIDLRIKTFSFETGDGYYFYTNTLRRPGNRLYRNGISFIT